jgi:hypothetical protein
LPFSKFPSWPTQTRFFIGKIALEAHYPKLSHIISQSKGSIRFSITWPLMFN